VRFIQYRAAASDYRSGAIHEEPAMRNDIIANLRYADAPRAIDFLCAAFGFERRAVYPDARDPKTIQHAQLTWCDRMIMISTAQDSEYIQTARMTTVAEAGGATVGLYLVVEDVDAHAERARAAGAEIFRGPQDESYGGRGYTARDPEGNVWSFGSYDPWG
jgi:uncharacterized glyoxalase superfamily protein PhnB